ncbi:GDSL-type esterase/lipase family protein [Saccharicrinis fermentans]|uniref:Multifunctional acyl-CoA thioesterase I and protease I and lysophospholipase L1 n=1 Tax=Saccharicrinis fermentans DSM 9555 = JCM 21142 TaxID=869213 RepID=W7Y0Y4_9BACT|nr:GDSL-type esterase/lipase family protein [Saccharicrinis fermentans]GAF01617.1 multifunctional acyl-CoA thioesterase I and protease I and lysophospholipase L1 [Saccharicrinis fermentans DSM 9555 = JCM 21142]
MKALSTTVFYTCFILLLFTSCSSRPVMIACVGDSITAGAKHKKQSETAYPKVLDKLLGDGYSVVNCGRSGATALKRSNFSYWNCNEISNVFALRPDIITIKLGTNDSKPGNWNAERFKTDYQCLIDTFLSIKPKPKIYLCLPVPVFDHHNFRIRGEVVAHEVIPIIRSLSEKNHLPLIDLYQPFIGKAALVPDGVHPAEEGAAFLAKILAQQIKE